MQVTHQIGDGFLQAYAAGTLPEAFNVVVASHISLCDEARARLETVEAVGGALLDTLDKVELAPDSLAATMALIEDETFDVANQTNAPSCDVLPTPVVDYVGGTLEDIKWRSLGMGVKQAVLKTSKEASMRLLFIPAGAKMPDHGHHGTEMTLVLKGAYLDGAERFARGDIEVANEDLEHHPVADKGEDCICLVASDAPLKFSGLLPRIVQPFVGI